MIVRSDRVVLPGGVAPAEIEIEAGRFRRVTPIARSTAAPASSVPRRPAIAADARVIDAGELVVMPGLVDTHVHVNEPGRAEWEGFLTATRAAAAGGVTTIVDMPLNSVPPTTTVAGLEAKRHAARGQAHVDVAFWGGVVPGNAAELEALAAAGVRGFKCFLSPSGVDEFPHVDEQDLRAAMPILGRLGLPLLAHAELPALLRDPAGEPGRYRTWLDSRPPSAECAAIELLTTLAREYGTRVHIVHLATAAALPALRAARAQGLAVTVETCPHYLTFAAEEIHDGDTALKCAPPIRGAAEREALWGALATGEIDLVASDHSPAPAALKHVEDGDFVAAWGGIASLQLGLNAVWTGAHARGFDVGRLCAWLADAPARLAGLDARKGRIAAGADADLVIWDPDGETVVDGAALYHRHPFTPYHGRRLRGRVHMTVLGGATVFAEGALQGAARGRLL